MIALTVTQVCRRDQRQAHIAEGLIMLRTHPQKIN